MYLKALEIQGFKSFPEKVTLSFEKDFTAIVGPNGSGKSNISDAVSWVMGEQRSRALRGNKMEDVIFAGSEDRGQLSFAQVSLILDNSGGLFDVDAPELMITRRYYRSGESEYYINKKSVRLKDVYSVLMDTGLGRDGYSVIGQGRIDEIISAKSEDRREVFEEAAGISRFRYRKEEAERKLEKTDDALLRVGDKISELELSVGPLREQAETAKKYLILRDELRDLEISVWVENLEKLSVKTVELEREFDEASANRDKGREELEALYADSAELSEMIRKKDTEAESLRGEITAMEALAAEYESAAAVVEAGTRSTEEEIERAEAELTGQKGRNEEMNARIEQKLERVSEIDRALAGLADEMQAVLKENESAVADGNEREREINACVAEAASLSSEAKAARARSEAAAASAEELGARLAAAEADCTAAKERLEAEKASYGECTGKIAAADARRTECENVVSGNRLRSEAREKRAADLREKLSGLKLQQGRLASRISLLTEMEKEYEGFSRAVKTVMQEAARGNLKNVCGTVADIIKTRDEYTVAIETALGGALQNVVVKTEEDGKAGINLLKRRDAGRATFLPMSGVKGRLLNESGLKNEYGILGTAYELVSFDPQYDGIVADLLGRTVVAEDMDTAIRVSRRNGARFRIVTLDGQMMNAGGSMTGGSKAANVGILSRANELKKLTAEAEKAEEIEKDLTAKLAEAERELAKASFETETALGELRAAQDELLALNSAETQLRRLVEDMEANAAQLGLLLEDTKAKLAAARSDIVRYDAQASEYDAAAEKSAARAKEISESRTELDARLEKMQTALDTVRAGQASLEAEKLSTLSAIEEWKSLLAGMETDRETKLRELEAKRGGLGDMREMLAEKRMLAEKQRSAVSEKRQLLSALTAERLEYEGRRDRCDKSAQDKNRELLDREREFSTLEQRKLAAQMEERQITDKLWETYELTRSAAARLRCEIESLPKATRRISELKRSIAALGTPNLGAIDEYERVSGRYDFLTEQRDDITKAKEELEGIIRDVTDEMKTIFIREFDAINKSFGETFSELFGGGGAELALEDENDVLNCGIDIRVRPPGKTLKNISLLSGGERAFVAIALYFAIMKVRPTPFCVLDEIEAALDEKNVDKFAQYLRRMSVNTQFLVITHRRGTMEEADMLYGVTMQHGISKLLSLDLEQALKDA